jgi:hypothetical protein
MDMGCQRMNMQDVFASVEIDVHFEMNGANQQIQVARFRAQGQMALSFVKTHYWMCLLCKLFVGSLKVMSQITLHHGKFKGISLCTSKDQASG